MRVGIIGLGWVGTSVAISTLHRGFVRELLLNDVRDGIAEGEALDLGQGASFYPSARVRTAAVEDMVDCDAVVISAGKGGGPGQSRLELLIDNARIVHDLAVRLAGCRGLVVVVTNPVDVLTHIVAEASGLPPERVIGTGTMLDTARLRHAIGRTLDLEPRSVHAQVVGEHGDSEVVLWSSAQVGGVPIGRFPGWDTARQPAIAAEVRRAAYEIIQRKGATNHAIGLVTAALLQWSLAGRRRVMTVSRIQNGALGLRDVCLSLPAIVGDGGADVVLEPALDEGEREALEASAEVLRKATSDARTGIV